MDVSDSEDIDLSPKEYFKINTFIPIIDNLNSALRFRLEAYKLLSERFGFLSRLTELTDEELREAASNLIHHYPDDLEHELESEIIHFAALIKGLVNAHILTLLARSKLIFSYSLMKMI